MPTGIYIRNPQLRPQTFRDCLQCGHRFGPLRHLSRKFCSARCKVAAQTTGITKMHIGTPEAKRAQRHLKYYVDSGRIIRPSRCEQCGAEARIEGAHYNYAEPLRVRWLCRSCHVKWDAIEPKGGTICIAVKRWEDFTGETATRA